MPRRASDPSARGFAILTPMTAYRLCSECPNPLTGMGPLAKTCSPKCRSKRSRRLKRQLKEAGEAKAMPEHQKEITERVRGEMDDIAHKVIEEELRPVVRETITQDTLKAISDMVGLTPRAVAAIEDDLASEDPVIRQRAYTLVMKYTVGHNAIVQPEDKDTTQPLVVNFELPRPELPNRPDTIEAEAVEVPDTESRECDTCHQMKTDFIAGSDRCTECFEGMHNKELELLEQTDPQHD